MTRLVESLAVIVFLVNFSSTYVISRSGNSNEPDTSGLYHGFGKITILNDTNFNNAIFEDQEEKLWLVEFYSHWCGYCIRFVCAMKAFASDVYEWREVVKIGTVDCANPMNNEICRKHGIMRVPALRIFPPNSEENFVGLDFGKGSETTITEMRENVAKILKSYHNSEEDISSSVNLKLLKLDTLEQLWSQVPSTVEYIILVFEPEDSLVGSQIALDLSRTPVLQVRLVDPKNKNLSQLVGVEDDETAAVILDHPPASTQSPDKLVEINDLTQVNLNEPISTDREPNLSASQNDIHSAHVTQVVFTRVVVENFTREGLNKAVRKLLIARGVNIPPELPKIPVIHTNVSVSEIKEAIRREEVLKRELNVKHLSSVVFQMDLEAAVIYAFTGEVSLVRNFSNEQVYALRELVSVLIKYFPTGEPGRQFFTELKEKELDNRNSSVCGEDVRNTFKTLQEKYHPFMKNPEWVGCRGTIPNLRGYPCGLWSLFHTLAAREELNDRNIPHEKPEVLNAMAGYIRHFFSCSQCAEHFNEMARTIPGNVTTQRDALVWLWKAHNNNLRLAGDVTEDPKHHKVQFPTKAVCPSCYAEDGSWDEYQVFIFLSDMYTNIVNLNPYDLMPTTPPPSTWGL